MASITRRGNTYRIRCSNGYDEYGRQVLRTMKWEIPDGMSAKKAEKEAKRQAILFEEQVRSGIVAEAHLKLSEFAEQWFENYAQVQLRAKTVDGYKRLWKVAQPELGHLYIDKIRPTHLLAFYNKLRKMPKVTSYHFNGDFQICLNKKKISRETFARRANMAATTVDSLANGNNVSEKNAQKVCKALGKTLATTFTPVGNGETLSETTVHRYHAMLSSMLNTAVDWQIIESNPARRVKPPKLPRSDPQYLEEDEAIRLLDLLEQQPMQYRTAVQVLLFTGMRRGELLGLEWKDIDFDRCLISIQRTCEYLPERGVFTDDTKNDSSFRVIKTTPAVIQMLQEYRIWQQGEIQRMGTAWEISDRLFRSADGGPMHPDTLSGWFHKFVVTKGIPAGIHLHSLRHTNATLQIANGVNIATVAHRLGHANTSTTARVYVHAIKSASAAAAEMLDVLLLQKKTPKTSQNLQ